MESVTGAGMGGAVNHSRGALGGVVNRPTVLLDSPPNSPFDAAMPQRSLVLALVLLVPALAAAQGTPPVAGEPPVDAPLPKKTIVVPVPVAPTPVKPAAPADPQAAQPEATPPAVTPVPAEKPVETAAPAAPPASDTPTPTPVFTPDPGAGTFTADAAAKPEEKPVSGAILDGHLREGPFLSGPGSLMFVMHHTAMLTLGGFATQLSWTGNNFELKQREALLAGALIGAGVGFGVSAWWQFNHWIDTPSASFGLVDSVIGGMFLAGLMNLFTQDPTAITWAAVIGTEIGAWLTTVIGGGDMPLNEGLFIASGGYWGLTYAALLLAIIRTSGNSGGSLGTAADILLIAPGIGAGALALLSMRYHPTTAQVLRADVFGTGAGLAVLLISILVLGDPIHNSTPYILSTLASAGAITAVSLLWEEAAERPNAIYYDPEKHRPYRTVWW